MLVSVSSQEKAHVWQTEHLESQKNLYKALGLNVAKEYFTDIAVYKQN